MSVSMYGMNPRGAWHIDDPKGLANAVEWMRRHVDLIQDNGRWIIPRSGSIVVFDKTNKRAIRVLGLLPEPSTQVVIEAMGWTWIDKANGEEVPK